MQPPAPAQADGACPTPLVPLPALTRTRALSGRALMQPGLEMGYCLYGFAKVPRAGAGSAASVGSARRLL